MNAGWREAWWLSRMELKKMTNLFSSVFILLMYIILLIVLTPFSDQVGANILYDGFFIGAIAMLPISCRKKEYQVTRISGDFWGVSYFNFLLQQPIPEEVLVKSRFLSNSVLYLLTNGLLIGGLLVWPTDLNTSLSLSESLSFFLFWLLIGLLIGSAIPTSEVGDLLPRNKLIAVSVLSYGSFFAAAALYYFLANQGIVEGSIALLKSAPAVTLVVTAVATVISYRLAYWYAIKKIRTNDYF